MPGMRRTTRDADAIIRGYLKDDGSLSTIPARRSKLLPVLTHVMKAFQPGMEYTEAQVNEILSRFHADTASLRRALIENALMEREGGGAVYRVIS